MDAQTAELLAKAERLTAETQMLLWRTGEPWVRRALAARRDLVRDLQKLVVTDDDLVARWASVPRPDPGLLSRAVDSARSEHSMMALVSGQELDADMCQRLAAKCTPIVGWELVFHQRPDEDVAAMLVHRYISAMSPIGDGPGRIFDEHLQEDPKLWVAAVTAVTWDTLPVLRSAAARWSLRNDLLEPVIEALERLDATSPGELPDRSMRIVDSVITDILRDAALPIEAIDRLASLRISADRRSELLARRSSDVSSTITALMRTTTDDHHSVCTVADHVDLLRELAGHVNNLQMPALLIADEALRHRVALGESVVRQLMALTRGPSSRELAMRLEELDRIEDLVAFTEIAGILVLTDVKDRLPVLIRLAAAGSREITDRNIPDDLKDQVASHFRPLRALLNHPVMLSSVLEAIDVLDDRSAETALHLLGEWEEDLPALLRAARHLEHD